MNYSEYKQFNVACNMFIEQPDRLEKTYKEGRLRLCADAMYIFYLHYTGGISIADIYYNRGFACGINEEQKNLAKILMDKSASFKK